MGWMFFGDLPTATMLAGAAIIVLSGLMIFAADQKGRSAGP